MPRVVGMAHEGEGCRVSCKTERTVFTSRPVCCFVIAPAAAFNDARREGARRFSRCRRICDYVLSLATKKLRKRTGMRSDTAFFAQWQSPCKGRRFATIA
ncbi:hypothetical protein KL86DES1_21959 [uncultured Desulfovibrio sp.]|uniref:Uncharacterized protein n=1 Tax=uncultured Desulfovibrio sp. TaxID=167968 RepID=A0A212LAD4_9BACT|nr:hypothetical protein KL86DES1_21959 [uncultured Desulfovibrio sp.]